MVAGENPYFISPPWLQEAWIRELRLHFDTLNQDYAGSRLRPPIIRIGSSMERLGEWNSLTRTLTIAEGHILSHPWESVLGTLRHEMAHQYVSEALGLPDAEPHGPEFQKACRILRAVPASRASGSELGSLDASTAERDRMLSRVKELLQLARSPNEHEAASAMRMAHKYLLKYNLDLAELDSPRDYETRHLGRSSARIQEWEQTLAAILQDHFFVLVIWTFSYDALRAMRGRILQISGTRENCEIAEYVHHYITSIAARLWRTHRAANGSRSGTKLQYLAGLVRGFGQKLDLEKKGLREEQGLIWLGDRRLEAYFRGLHPRVRHATTSGVRRGEGYDAGVRDGRRIIIRRPIGGEAERRGRLIE